MTIDADRVESELSALLETFCRILAQLDKRGSLTKVYMQGAIKGIRYKAFGTLPPGPVNTMTVPSHNLPDPLTFPTAPITVALAELRHPQDLARTFRATPGRIFASAMS